MTVPTGPAHIPGPGESHHARQVAESFGSDAERARPRYPHALIYRIAIASPGRDLLDVGCGTGIVARQFQALGCRVIGVDPDAKMVEFARQRGLGPTLRYSRVLLAVDSGPGRAKGSIVILKPWPRMAVTRHIIAPGRKVAHRLCSRDPIDLPP